MIDETGTPFENKTVKELFEDSHARAEKTRKEGIALSIEAGFKLPTVAHLAPIPADSNPFYYDNTRIGIELVRGWMAMHNAYDRGDSPLGLSHIVLLNKRTGQRILIDLRECYPKTAEQTETEKIDPDSSDTTEIDKLIEETSGVLKALREERAEILKKTKISCGNCDAESMIKDVTYIQPHWYEPPHGCMGGDTWHESESYALLRCPHCKAILQITAETRPELMALKYSFKEIEKQHKR